MALNISVTGLVISVIWFSIEYLAANYFTELMNRYQIAPKEIHGMFLNSVHQYLVGASTIAIMLAVIVSYLLSNRVLRPLNEVSRAIQRMSNGDRDARARTLSKDELGDLAKAFNLMAHHIQQAEHLRENMVADVAHELRTPITNIRGYVEGLRDQIILPSDRILCVLEEESLRLGDLVESLLKLSRADAAEFNLKFQLLDVREIFSTTLKRYAEKIKQKNLYVNICVPQEAQLVTADMEKMQIIVSNFIDNACQYSPAGSEIRIWSERKNGELRMNITNQAEIIIPTNLVLIFERFYRGEKSRSRNSGGAGIGLAIVKKLVEAHGGSVGASSDNKIFTIWCSIPDRIPAITAPS